MTMLGFLITLQEQPKAILVSYQVELQSIPEESQLKLLSSLIIFIQDLDSISRLRLLSPLHYLVHTSKYLAQMVRSASIGPNCVTASLIVQADLMSSTAQEEMGQQPLFIPPLCQQPMFIPPMCQQPMCIPLIPPQSVLDPPTSPQTPPVHLHLPISRTLRSDWSMV